MLKIAAGAISVAIISLLFTGCAGVRYGDSVHPIELSYLSKREASTRVLANAVEWRGSGVRVKKGNSYRIKADGRWTLGVFANWAGPDGIGAHTLLAPHFSSYNIIRPWSGATLIGKVGDSGEPFIVGHELEIDPKTDGILYFRINEKTAQFDNKGFVTVRMELVQSEGVSNTGVVDHPPRFHHVAAGQSRSSSSRWAVVIGVSEYASKGESGISDLPFAQADAHMFAEWLTKAGWHASRIRCLTNEQATDRNIRIALESWLTKARDNDLVVLYWAGHGFPDPEDPEKVYFACHDTDPNIPATGFRMDRVISSLKERNVRNVVVIADTCHAGKLITRGERGFSVVPAVKRMQRKDSVPKGWVFMVSADADRKAVEHSSWRNGAFTHCLLEGLGGKADGFQSVGPKDGTVTLGELREYLRTAMPDETQKVLGVAKHPLITTSSGDPSIWNLTLQ